MNAIKLLAIGKIQSPYYSIKECPTNGWTNEQNSIIHIESNFLDGMVGLEVGMLIHVLWWFDKAPRNILKNKVGNATYDTGVFAMRSPHRPNPIALSLCQIKELNNNLIKVKGLEALDGSIVLDIKKAINYESSIL